jgi:hypothetical protein
MVLLKGMNVSIEVFESHLPSCRAGILLAPLALEILGTLLALNLYLRDWTGHTIQCISAVPGLSADKEITPDPFQHDYLNATYRLRLTTQNLCYSTFMHIYGAFYYSNTIMGPSSLLPRPFEHSMVQTELRREGSLEVLAIPAHA